jgi:putative membrane protein insertion efficiency factor
MTAARPTRDETNFTPPDAGSNHGLIGAAFRLYKALISPVLHAIAPSRCLYLPTCSEYAYTAIARFGVARGSWMAMRRFARCHPWATGGLDPVPERIASTVSRAVKTASSVAGCSGPDHLP